MKIARSVAVVALVLATAPLHAQKATLQSKLKAEFEGKNFVTKIRFGSYVTGTHPRTGQRLTRLVDTEVYAGGAIRYYARRPLEDFMESGFYTSIAQIERSIERGTRVWVATVELKDDRIELLLSRTPGQPTAQDYGKLKVMLAKGYETTDYEVIVEGIARSLVVERFERVYAVVDEYTRLKRELGEADTAYKSTSVNQPNERIAGATRIVDLCRKLALNRSSYAALGKPDNEAAAFSARADQLQGEVQQMQAAAKAARVNALEQRCEQGKADGEKALASLRSTKVTSEAGWESKKEQLTRYEAILADLETAQKELVSAGGVPPAQDVKWLQDQRQAIPALSETLMQERARAASAEIDSRYRQLEKKRPQLQDAYMRSFGTAQERPNLQALLDHLQAMYDNRIAAAKAGEKGAQQQAEALMRDMKKLRPGT